MLNEYDPAKLIVFSRDELKAARHARNPGSTTRACGISSATCAISRASPRVYGVDVVIHAAALKQVRPVNTTRWKRSRPIFSAADNVIDAALDAGVKTTLALSTDKAVNPVNLYGATKLAAEKLFVQGQPYAGEKATRLSCPATAMWSAAAAAWFRSLSSSATTAGCSPSPTSA